MKRFILVLSALLLLAMFLKVDAGEAQVETAPIDPLEIQQGEIETLRILSNNSIPKKVIVVLNSSTEPFVFQLIQTIAAINEESERLDLKVHVICSSRSKSERFMKEIIEQDFHQIVEVNQRFYTADQWMQDWGEIAVAQIKDKSQPQMIIVDSNRGRGLAGLPKIFADLWDAYYIKNPRRGVKGDYGGNIEVTPDNVLIQGTTSTTQLRNLFDEHGYSGRRALLDTNWLQVGHVDEYVTFVPNPDAQGGYTIVKSDPALAFQLIKNATEEELNATNYIYRETIWEIHEDLNNNAYTRIRNANYDLSKDVDILKAPHSKTLSLEARNARKQRLHWLVDLNTAISELIDQNIEILKTRIREVTNTPEREFQVVSLPTIFTGGKYGNEVYRCVAMMPGVVNMLILGDQLIIPDAQMPMLNNFIRHTMGKIKLKSHFLDDMAYHNLSGEIHCGTNVIRKHDQYWTYPDHIIDKGRFEKLFQSAPNRSSLIR